MSDQRNQATQTPRRTNNNSEMEVNLSELFYRLIEKWVVIVLCAFLGAGIAAGYVFVLATPMYEATSKLYVMNAGNSAINLSDLQIGSYLANDYQEVFKTWEVHEQVIRNLDLDYTYSELQKVLRISNPSDTRILYITVTSDDPNEAMSIANEYLTVARKYIKDTMDTDEPRDFSLALLPVKPVKPNKTLSLLLGFVLGAFTAFIIVVVRFIIDDRLKTSDDVQRFGNMPTLAVVPILTPMKKGKSHKGAKER